MADIVVIDDEPRYRRLIAQVLTGAGHEVRQAGDGAEGLAMCLQRTPQVVVTDIVMPGMEGIETILRLTRERPGVAVLAISGAEPASVYLRAATALGAAGSLPKPFTVHQLLAAVDRLLAAGRALPAQPC
jgi:CheY-like chemotaxis protein